MALKHNFYLLKIAFQKFCTLLSYFESLPSYDDVNYRLDTKNGKFLLKVFHGEMSKNRIRLQVKLCLSLLLYRFLGAAGFSVFSETKWNSRPVNYC